MVIYATFRPPSDAILKGLARSDTEDISVEAEDIDRLFSNVILPS